jgi:CelD/BcsL family acetyltransferase involved in cellulose biosynthesis
VVGIGAAGGVVVSVVPAGEHVVAPHLGLRSRDDFIWYKATFNTAFRRYSPGEILLGSLIEYARAEGYTFSTSRGRRSLSAASPRASSTT